MFQQQALIAEMPKLRKFALRLTKALHDADDLLQSTVLRALEKKDYFEDGTNLFSWTSKMMFNLFVTDYRQKRRYETQYDPEHYIDKLSVQPRQEAHADLITVNENMKRLSPEHRQILVLVGVKGYSYEESAKSLKLPIGTVRSRLSRARKNLHHLLETPAPNPLAANKPTVSVPIRFAA